MAFENQDIRFELAWLQFLESVKKLVRISPEERGMGQFQELKEHVFKMLENPFFLEQLRLAFQNLITENSENAQQAQAAIGEALILELTGFSKGVAIILDLSKEDTPKEKRKGWKIRKWFGRGSTVNKSVKDLLTDLPFWAKGTLTVFGELLDLFKR